MEETPNISLPSQVPVNPVPVPPVEPPSPPKTLPLKWIIIIIALLAGIVLTGTYFIFKSQSGKQTPQPAPQVSVQPAVSSTPTPDETANWKTYTNKTYGFSIKYPSDLEVEDKSSQFPPFTIFITDKTKQVPSEGGSKINLYAFVEIKSSNSSLMYYVNDTKNNLEYIDKKKVGEIEFVIAREKFGMTGGNFDRYLAQNRDYIITFANSPYALDEQIFNQILSTFKFINTESDKNLSDAKLQDMINNCEIIGDYIYHSGEKGIVLKNNETLELKNKSVEEIKQLINGIPLKCGPDRVKVIE